MNQWIVSGATGLVLGIMASKIHSFAPETIPFFVIAGLISIALSFFSLSSRKTIWPFSFVALFCLGIANTTYFINTTSPDHLSQIVSTLKEDRNLILDGIVIQPPDVRELYTIIPLKPLSLKKSNHASELVGRGLVYVKMYPSVGEIYSSIGYGDHIELRGVQLREPAGAVNPGAFDMKKFLNNQGFFATASIRKSTQITKTKGGSGNPLIRVSEYIKNRLLITIKQTIPYPESSFLGGVLLGLRSGLSTEIKDTFRAAGVSHVLAVSGLHVTIITLFFMGMFKLLRIPPKSSFVVIICALVLFTLITGARPSTVRAAIMNGVTLLFFYFRGIKLDRSFLLGISIAALYILLRNPMLISEASFLFSFSAVLSLSLLTRPVFQWCCKHLRGFFRITLFLEVIVFGVSLFVNPAFLKNQPGLLGIGVLILLLAAGADRFLPPFLEFRRLPNWFSTFFAAQIAIQLGMLPLTALFFKKVSVAAPLANFIAIPLIGIIVQLGLFAGILGAIPIIGPFLSLTLNAANWLFIKLFLASATFFGTRFPYPDVSPPGKPAIGLYYFLLLIIAAWPWLQSFVVPRLRFIAIHWRSSPILTRLIMLTAVGLFLASRLAGGFQASQPRLVINLLDPSLFFMGGGNAVHLKTPLGRHYLIDAGPRYVLKQNQPVVLDIGRRIVIPALLQLKARNLDGIICTSSDSYCSGGIASILDNSWIHTSKIFHGLPFNSIRTDASADDILQMLNDPSLFIGNERRRAELTAWALRDMFAIATKNEIPMETIRAGSIIQEETVKIGNAFQNFKMSVINPPHELHTGSYSSSSNSVVLRIQYGKITVVLLSDAGKTAQSDILNREILSAQLIQLASNGASFAFHPEFLEKAKGVIVAPQPSTWAQKDFSKTREMVASMGVEVFRTDQGGAISVSSNGSDLQIKQNDLPDTRILIP